MTRRRLVLVSSALLAAVASISFQPGRTFVLVDAAGATIDRAYVLYQFRGHRPNFAHPVSYEATPLTLARGDGGRVAVPAAWQVHAPFPIETHPSRRIEIVYVPRLHNAWGHLNDGSPSIANVFVVDQPGVRATVFDLSDRPQLWEGTLRNLSSIIGRLVAPPVEGNHRPAIDDATAALTRELISDFRQEVSSFLSTYGALRRPRPEMPASVRWDTVAEQARWNAMTDDDLAKEPTWGVLIGRLFTDELENFERWAAGSR